MNVGEEGSQAAIKRSTACDAGFHPGTESKGTSTARRARRFRKLEKTRKWYGSPSRDKDFKAQESLSGSIVDGAFVPERLCQSTRGGQTVHANGPAQSLLSPARKRQAHWRGVVDRSRSQAGCCMKRACDQVRRGARLGKQRQQHGYLRARHVPVCKDVGK